jgi:hypothetical protein
MMHFWTFMAYVTEAHTCPITDWWAIQVADVRAAFDLLVTTLKQTEDWEALRKPRHKVLTDRHAGLCELMFKVEGIGKFRGLGLWRPDMRDFILFGACRKMMHPFSTVPPTAYDDAYRLMHQFNEGRGGTNPYV